MRWHEFILQNKDMAKQGYEASQLFQSRGKRSKETAMDVGTREPVTIEPLGDHVRGAIRRAARRDRPYRYWLLDDVLPSGVAAGSASLPFAAPFITDTLGKRETHNQQRLFLSAVMRRRFRSLDVLAAAFQDAATVALIEDACQVSLAGGFLRIEYTQDTAGFWLEPHTDIGAKMFTMLIYLSDHPDAPAWGTDIMNRDGEVLDRAPGRFNTGLMFVPAADTWHGFTRRTLTGVRRSLIINYVRPEWRSTHELAFPGQPVIPRQ
jgi:hypothetical protein